MKQKTHPKTLLTNKRFVSIVGMLGSNGPGEAANAAALATKMLAEAGLTWGELLADAGGPGDRYAGGTDWNKETVLQAEIQQLKLRIGQLQRKEEAAETRARRAENHVRDLRKELATSVEREQQLRSQLQAAQAKKGWTFDDDTAAAGSWVPPPPLAHHDWLEDLLQYRDHDLNEWERNFFTDFAEKNKPIKTEKQYAIFKRVAEKLKLPLDF
jgi:hypothetical protein